MGAFKYETILPPSAQADGKLSVLNNEILEDERNTAYAKGFKDGVNVTKDAVEVETNRLLLRISEDLSDIQFTNEQACVSVMKSVEPLISAIVKSISPTVLKGRILEDCQALLDDIMRDFRGTTVEIETPPDLLDDVRKIADDHALNISIIENAAMSELELRLNWLDGFDHFDMEGLRQGILEKMSDYVDCLSEGNDERRCEPG